MTSPVAEGRRPRRGASRRVAVVAARRRRASSAVLFGAVLFVILVAAAGLQIRLISGQRQLDRLERRIVDAQVRQYDLRQQEALLRSPAQIAQIAASDLGMVRAAPPVMLRPAPRVLGSSEPQTPPTTTDVGDGSSDVAAGEGGGAR